MEDIKQPDIDMQRMMDELINATPEEVEFCGKTIKIGWLHNRTIRKFSHIMVTEEDPIKKNVKLCTIVMLNNVFKIFFFGIKFFAIKTLIANFRFYYFPSFFLN